MLRFVGREKRLFHEAARAYVRHCHRRQGGGEVLETIRLRNEMSWAYLAAYDGRGNATLRSELLVLALTPVIFLTHCWVGGHRWLARALGRATLAVLPRVGVLLDRLGAQLRQTGKELQ